ncbi:MAG: DUF1788 domain-containing protein [Anaerolineales bacterium]|nr:DUF1788 domain-containing protein [Anaerolineales bacterium]
MLVSSLRDCLERLEADLTADPMRHYSYHDMPFAVCSYPPEAEWEMRHEVALLATRIHNETGREVVTLSLSELLWQAIAECEGLEAVVELERREGFAAAQRQIQEYLSDPDWRPLPEMVSERLALLDPARHLVFLVRAGALAPGIYRVSKLLDEMKGRTMVPCVLFMPATTQNGIRFMGISENEGRGSYHVKVYQCS